MGLKVLVFPPNVGLTGLAISILPKSHKKTVHNGLVKTSSQLQKHKMITLTASKHAAAFDSTPAKFANIVAIAQGPADLLPSITDINSIIWSYLTPSEQAEFPMAVQWNTSTIKVTPPPLPIHPPTPHKIWLYVTPHSPT